MSGFDEREDQFEKRFALEEELKFKTLARRNRLVGRWAAQLLGYAGAQADSYVAELVGGLVGVADADALFGAVRAGFEKAGVEMSDHRIRRKIEEAAAEASADIKAAR